MSAENSALKQTKHRKNFDIKKFLIRFRFSSESAKVMCSDFSSYKGNFTLHSRSKLCRKQLFAQLN